MTLIYDGSLYTSGDPKTVELGNGWLVSVFRADNPHRFLGYVSEDGGDNWNLLFEEPASLTTSSIVNTSSYNNNIYIAIENNIYYFNVTEFPRGESLTNEANVYQFTFDSVYESFYGDTKLYVEDNNLHVIYGSLFDSQVVTRYEIYYRRGSLANGGIDWEYEDQIWEAQSGSGYNYRQMVFFTLNNEPYLLYERPTSGRTGSYLINPNYSEREYDTDNLFWGSVEITDNTFYSDIIFDENNRFLFVYVDTGGSNYGNIYLTESTDNGLTWSTPIIIHDGEDATEPQITIDRYNDPYIFYLKQNNQLRYRKFFNDAWGDEQAGWHSIDRYSLTFDRNFNSTIVGYNTINTNNDEVRFNYILVNSPPLAPTPIKKGNFDARDEARIEWIFNDDDVLDYPSAYQFQLERISDGTLIIDTGKTGPTPPNEFIADEFYDVAANTLDNNETYRWRVKTWDVQDAEGPWSDWSSFYTSAKPTVTITSPEDGYVSDLPSVSVDWVMNDPLDEEQSAFQVELINNGNVVSDSGKIQSVSQRSYKIDYDLENYESYTIRIKVWDEHDVVSEVDTINITVDYVSPVVPTFVTNTSKKNACIYIHITNPEPQGYEPTVVYNDVYRKDNDNFIRIARNIEPNGTFVDYTVASGREYTYYVRAYGDNETFQDSETATDQVSFKYVRLSLISNLQEDINLIYNSEREYSYELGGQAMQFAGRSKPVVDFPSYNNQPLSLNYTIIGDELYRLEDMLLAKETMLYRDYRGRKRYVVAMSFNVSDDTHFLDWYNISMQLTDVDYKEGV